MAEASGYVDGLIEVLSHTRGPALDNALTKAVELITGALTSGKPFLLCGNGASAADTLHISSNLVGRYARERVGLNVISLIANPAFITAWGNDYDFDSVFSRQVEAYGVAGGVLLGISTSGNSKNVVMAFSTARTQGLATIGLTGQGGGKLAGLSDVLIDVPSRSTPRIQEVHVCLYHYLCEQIEARCGAVK